tara:strand:- start:2572 stop:3147 length:576 start_codon:yes stop_codon:yes gene_type:complete
MTKVIQQMDMTKAAKLFFTNYFDFSGRASRGEFWWAYLAFFIISFILAIVDGVIVGIIFGFTDNELLSITENEFLSTNGFFSNIFSLVTLIGWISLTSRRLQDNGHSGWWQLSYFSIIPTIILWVFFISADGNPVLLSFSIIFTIITLALYILILVWLILPPTEDENRWGLNPLYYENQNKTFSGADPKDW